LFTYQRQEKQAPHGFRPLHAPVKHLHHNHGIKTGSRTSYSDLVTKHHFLVVLADDEQMPIMSLSNQKRNAWPCSRDDFRAWKQREALQPRIGVYGNLRLAICP
jgi:hypothetical protein